MTAPTQPRISLVMIVKNEEQFLPGCLESVRGAVDEIIVVDTGSTDQTPWIARAYGATVIEHPWQERFDTARNVAMDAATGDWILSLDADERLLPLHWEKIRRIATEAPAQVLGCFIYCISPTPQGTDVSEVLRFVRNRPDLRFIGRVHEDLGPAIVKAGGATAKTPIAILHEGYRGEIVVSRNKWDRNERMLLLEDQERPGQPLMQYNLGHHFLIRSEEAKAQGDFERQQELAQKSASYFVKGLQIFDPTHMAYQRLLFEAEMAGVKISQFPGHRHMPQDPVSLGLDPDPLARVA